MSKTCEATHVVVAGHIYVYTWYSKNGLFCKDIFMHNNWIQFTYSVREGSLKKKSFPLHNVLIVRLWCTHSPTLLCLWQLVSCPPCRICCLGSSSLHLHWHAETQSQSNIGFTVIYGLFASLFYLLFSVYDVITEGLSALLLPVVQQFLIQSVAMGADRMWCNYLTVSCVWEDSSMCYHHQTQGMQ